MRKITLALLALLLPLAGCGKKTFTEAGLRALLEAKVTQPILAFEYGDYDGDGTYEAFAFVGEEDEYEGYMGAVWFVNAAGAQMLEASETGYWQIVQTVAFGGRKFAWVEEYYATGGLVNLWSVRDGKPCREDLSGVGGALEKLDESNLLLYHSTLDAVYSVADGIGTHLGRTVKPYWFYWDGERFREYGGMPVSMAEEEKLRKLDGIAEILDSILGLVHDSYYRGNGIINIGYFVPEGVFVTNCYYMTLQLDDDKLTVVEEGSGFYLPALAPGIAVYPDLPEIFN